MTPSLILKRTIEIKNCRPEQIVRLLAARARNEEGRFKKQLFSPARPKGEPRRMTDEKGKKGAN